MQHCWIYMLTHLTWAWQSVSVTDYLWGVIGLLATGWFLSTLRRS